MDKPREFYEHGIGVSIPSFKEGMRQLDAFISLLKICLIETIPGAKPKKASGFGWRGFKIIGSPLLKSGDFYFEIYTDSPTVLVFEESYNYGGYAYPFYLKYDLLNNGFFHLDSEAQKQMICNFLSEALTEAQRWHESPLRKQLVPKSSLEVQR